MSKRWSVGVALLMLGGPLLSMDAYASTTASITVNGTEQTGDSNTIAVTFNGFTETVHYGQFSSSASIASALAAMFSRDYLQAGLCAAVASPGSSIVNFKLRGGAAFGALDVTGSTTSFNVTSSGFASQISSNAYDTGTVTLTVGGQVAAQTNYGEGATPDSIAAGLARAAVNSYVYLSAVGNTVYFEAIPSYSGTDYSFSISSNYNSSLFSQPSFSGAPSGGNLEGGSGTSSSQQQIYSYNGVSYDGVGNVTGYSDSAMGSWNMLGGYDSLNRLTSATAGSNVPAPYTNNFGCWYYDDFGNRKSQSMSTTPCNNNPPLMSWASYTTDGTNNTPDNGRNQVKESQNGVYQYDAAGNVIFDGVNTYRYDAEGRICAVSFSVSGTTIMTGYLYDAAGARIAKGHLQNLNSCDPAVNGFQLTNAFTVGPSNEQLSEYQTDADGDWQWQHSNVWAGSQLLATYEVGGSSLPNPNDPGNPFANSTLHFYLNDPLGTRRVQTDFAGVVEQSCMSLPFGDGLSCTPPGGNGPNYAGTLSEPTEHHFTGKERDQESGNDYFGARYYASSMGSWLSPDKPFADQHTDNPQSWNLYEYARNNPLRNVDVGGSCVAPALSPGEVGVCVESYIQAARLPGGFPNMLGYGNNRGPIADDARAGFKTQTLITVDLPDSLVKFSTTAGPSKTDIGTLQGGATQEITDVYRSGADVFLTLTVTGQNGFALNHLPGPSGTIKMQFTLKISADGQVRVISDATTKYPSISIFSYLPNGAVFDDWEQTESGNLNDLQLPASSGHGHSPSSRGVPSENMKEGADYLCKMYGNPSACGAFQ